MSSDIVQEVMAIFREEALELVQRTLAVLNRAVNGEGADRAKQINEVCRLLHTLKGAAAAVDANDIQQRAHELEDRIAELGTAAAAAGFTPLFAELEAIEAELTSAQAAVPPLQTEEVAPAAPAEPKPSFATRKAASPVPAPAAAPVPNGDAGAGVVDWLRVAPERVDHLHAQLGELVLTRLQQDRLMGRITNLRTAAARAMTREREMRRALIEARSEFAPETWRRLRAHTQSAHSGWSTLFESLQLVCRDARALQAQSAVVSTSVEESIQGLRLMPLAPFFDGYAKTARDAARRTGKLVRFHVKADDTEVDRAVLTRLSDALLHLVRNAVVHGLELPDARSAWGKPAEGNLTLEARSAGSYALIRVVDDGAGVDVERVRAKARVIGFEGDDLLDILTHPGFSTRDAADELAGRGVGLDVVHSVVRGLGGTLELQTERGVGSVFTIRVPIAASTTMGLIIELGEHRFGIMLSDVERVLRPIAREIERVEGRLAVRIGDEMVALVSLADVLGVKTESQLDDHIPVVVIRHGRHRLGLVVDDIPTEHALVVRPFAPAFQGAEVFAGGAVQPDHSIVPVIATPALFARAVRSAPASLTRQLRAERPRAPSSLHALVVDDSITMRTLLRNVLHAAGYQVTVAEDGVVAMSRLEAMTACHIVVTDLQMPHMDGIDLCKSIRARGGSYVPIVMVTSVDNDDEKSRALAAGADAYVVKAVFEQSTFLKRVDTLVRGPS
jgi:two-component system, chemotaxis family, sensor kinase CheA